MEIYDLHYPSTYVRAEQDEWAQNRLQIFDRRSLCELLLPEALLF